MKIIDYSEKFSFMKLRRSFDDKVLSTKEVFKIESRDKT